MTTSIGDLIWGVAFSSATACSAAQRSGHWSLMHLGRVNGSRLFVGSRVRWASKNQHSSGVCFGSAASL
jgi:hypothetical protein